jgi:hypothetical protein
MSQSAARGQPEDLSSELCVQSWRPTASWDNSRSISNGIAMAPSFETASRYIRITGNIPLPYLVIGKRLAWLEKLIFIQMTVTALHFRRAALTLTD